jgi:hypothetical protein
VPPPQKNVFNNAGVYSFNFTIVKIVTYSHAQTEFIFFLL